MAEQARRAEWPLPLPIFYVSILQSLSQEVVDAKTLNVFKRRLDIALGVNGTKGNGEKAGLGY